MQGMHKYLFIFLVLLCAFTLTSRVYAISGDANGDSVVDGRDYIVWLNNYATVNTSGPSKGDFNSSGKVDGVDYILWLNNYGLTATPTSGVNPTQIPSLSTDWNQFGGNAQKTNGTTQVVGTPWKLRWQWNASGANGKKDPNHQTVPNLSQPIVGSGFIFAIGNDTLYALNQSSGTVVWSKSGLGSLEATPVYAEGYIYIINEAGTIHKLQGSNGQTVSSVAIGNTVTEAPSWYSGTLYVTTKTGKMVAYNTSSLTKLWEYTSNSPFVTGPAFSVTKNTVVAVSQDLYVHGVNGSNGSGSWRVKPTNRTYTTADPEKNYTVADPAWPVIAELHGIVFIRYRLEWNTLWTWNPFPTTNSAIRQNLVSKPDQQSLFALNISNGTTAFIPAVGNGGQGDGGDLSIGPPPAIQIVNGKEVAYIPFRNGLTCQSSPWCDAREDTAMGEMVLDSTTVSGYQAGDMRFVRFEDIQTDEMISVSSSGDSVFHAHWLINAAHKITDRSAGKGATFANPIETTESPFVIWRQCNGTNICNFPGCAVNTNCSINCTFNSATHHCSDGLYSYGDQRGYPSGFYEYLNDIPYEPSGAYFTMRPFTIVSNGMVMVKTIDGGLMVFENGSPGASLRQDSNVAGVSDQRINQSMIPTISYKEALKYIDNTMNVTGTIRSVVDHRPKAMYLGFTDPHDGALLVRVFEKDLHKFNFDLNILKGKKVIISGRITMYWPENIDPEIVVSSPDQIKIVE